MVKYFRTISTHVEGALFEKFRDICKNQKCSMHSILKDFIEDYIEQFGGEGGGDEQSRQAIDSDKEFERELEESVE